MGGGEGDREKVIWMGVQPECMYAIAFDFGSLLKGCREGRTEDRG